MSIAKYEGFILVEHCGVHEAYWGMSVVVNVRREQRHVRGVEDVDVVVT